MHVHTCMGACVCIHMHTGDTMTEHEPEREGVHVWCTEWLCVLSHDEANNFSACLAPNEFGNGSLIDQSLAGL